MGNDDNTQYQSGFGNHFSSEAIPGTLPKGQNNPQRVAHGLYAELLSGTAFTAPRAVNQHTWMYRRQPSVVCGAHQPFAQAWWKTGERDGLIVPPDPLRWHPVETGESGQDFIEGLRTMVVNGDAAAHVGMAAHVYVADRSMDRRALINADGEMLLVPQQGRLRITTELGLLEVSPGEIALLPRGLAFKIALPDGPVRGYVAENYGAPLRLPELGPIGSNGLANPRDFLAPVAAFEPADAASGGFERTETRGLASDPSSGGEKASNVLPLPYERPQTCRFASSPPGGYEKTWDGPTFPHELIRKSGGALWRATLASTPFNVVGWHGNLTPLKYDTRHFMAIGSISFDHPDPSIFTVLSSPSDTPGVANFDFVIFPPRWMVAENTFRPPWFHRNVMSEFMGLVYGQYDAKPEGFRPGGASLHNCMVPHGPDADAFARASTAELAPQKLDNTLAFMFESRLAFRPTEFAVQPGRLDASYAQCWAGL